MAPWRDQSNLTVGGATSTATVSGLQPYTEYTFQVFFGVLVIFSAVVIFL